VNHHDHHSGLCKHCEHARWLGDRPNLSSKQLGIRACDHPKNPVITASHRRVGLVVIEECNRYQRYPGAET